MQTRVYRLDVTYPEGSDAPGWAPEEGWHSHPDDPWGAHPDTQFAWPRARLYLSRSGAEQRAKLLRKYGAQVVIVPSNPVTWPEPEET